MAKETAKWMEKATVSKKATKKLKKAKTGSTSLSRKRMTRNMENQTEEQEEDVEDDAGVDGDGKYTGTVNPGSGGGGGRKVDGEGNGLEEGREEAQGSEDGEHKPFQEENDEEHGKADSLEQEEDVEDDEEHGKSGSGEQGGDVGDDGEHGESSATRIHTTGPTPAALAIRSIRGGGREVDREGNGLEEGHEEAQECRDGEHKPFQEENDEEHVGTDGSFQEILCPRPSPAPEDS